MSDERDSFAIERARKAAAFAAKKMRPQLSLSLSLSLAIAGALAVGGLVLAAHSGAASHALERMHRFADARSSQAAAVSLSSIGHRIFELLCPLFGDCPAEAPLAPQAPSAQPRPAAAPPARAATTTAAVFATETPRPAAPAPSATPARASPPAPSAAQAIIERIVQREADAPAFDARLAALEQSLIIRMNQLAAVRTHQSERAADNVADQISRATTITALDTGVLTGKITNAIDTASAAIASLTATELVATNATTTNLHVSGSASLNGDLTVSGTLTANILNVQGVSSAGALVGPFVTATSSSATSTFAGGFSVAGESILATTTVNGTLTVNGNTYVSEGGQLTVGDKIIAPGEIGLGTSTPAGKLAIQSTDADQTALLIRGASGQASPLLDIFSGSDQSLLHLAANGNVGIGTTTPGSTLTVNGNSISAVAFTKSSGAPAFNFDTANSRLKVHGTTPYIQLIDGANASSQIKQNGAALQFLVNDGSVTGMHIGQTGNVGIGTTSPQARLHVAGNLEIGALGGAQTIVAYNSARAQGATLDLYNTSTGNTTLTNTFPGAHIILSPTASGNIGIGTTDPQGKLSVTNTSSGNVVTGLYLKNATAVNGGIGIDFDNTSGNEVGARINSLRTVASPQETALIFSTRVGTVLSEKVRIDANGNVGIGTTSPMHALSVYKDSGTTDSPVAIFMGGGSASDETTIKVGAPINQARLGYNNGSGGPGAYGFLSFDATKALSWNSSGNVGIGTTSPGTNKLYVAGETRTDAHITAGSGLWVRGNRLTMGMDYSGSGAHLGLFSGGSERMTIQSTTGNVGIGTTSPSDKLHVFGGNISIDSSANHALFFKDAGVNEWHVSRYESNNSFNIVESGAAERLTILSGGNVGIGTTTPWGKLSITGSGTGTGLAFAVADSANTPRFVIQDNGNVGIGNIAPTDKLSILNSVANDTPAAGIVLSRYQASPTDMRAAGLFNYYDSAASKEVLAFGLSQAGTPNTIANAKMVIRNDGNVGIGTTSPLYNIHVKGNGQATGLISGSTSGQLVLEDTAVGDSSRPFGYLIQNDGILSLGYGNRNGAGLKTGSTDVLNINGNNVGIGTAAPTQSLTSFSGTASAARRISVGDTADRIVVGFDSAGVESNRNYSQILDIGAGLQFATRSNLSSTISFFTNNSSVGTTPLERMRITPDGNVGIGTTSPWKMFSVAGDIIGTNITATGTIAVLASGGGRTLNVSYTGGQGRVLTSGTDDLVLGANNTAVIRIESDGNAPVEDSLVIDAGNVGIGTTTPAQKLDVYGNIAIGTAGSGGYIYGDTTNQYLRLSNSAGSQLGYSTSYINVAPSFTYIGGGIERFRISNSSGNVGIGTTSPLGKLHISSGSSGVTSLNGGADELVIEGSGDSGLSFITPNTAAAQILFGDPDDSDRGRLQYLHASDAMTFFTNNAERVRIDNSGNVGIGTTTPGALLTLHGGNIRTDGPNAQGLQLYRNAAAIGSVTSASNMLTFQDLSGNGFRFLNSSSATIMSILGTNGNVGIGTTGPDGKLHVMAGSAGTVTANANADDFVVEGSATVGSSILKPDASWGFLYFGSPSATNAAGLQHNYSANAYQVFTNTATPLSFLTNGSERVTISSTGNIGIGTTTPGAQLHVKASSGEVARFSDELSGDIYLSLGRTALGQLAGKINFNVPARRLDFGNHTNGAVLSIDTINGNVGIGTTSPVEKLEVGGNLLLFGSANREIRVGTTTTNVDGYDLNVRAGDSFNFAGSGSPRNGGSLYLAGGIGYGAGGVNTGGSVFINGGPGTGGGGLSGNVILANIRGNVGIGTTSPASKLTIGTGNAGFDDGYGAVWGSTSIKGYSAANVLAFNTNGSEAMRIINNGNVGIGTTSPSAKLEISGTSPIIRLTDTDVSSTYSEIDGVNGHLWLYADKTAGTGASAIHMSIDGTERLRIDSTGNVGIGTTSPSQKLEIAGSIYASNGDIMLSGSRVVKNTTDNLYLYSAVGKDIVFATDLGSEKARILNNGNVGIGTTNPNDAKLEVKGGTVCVDTDSNDSATSCIASESDERLKTNIQAISASTSLDIINALNPVSFDWRASDPAVLAHWPALGRYAGKEHSIGLIAQEVMPVLPEALSLETVGDDEVQYYQLDYTKFVPHLIGAVKELWAKVQDLGQKIAALLQSDEAQNAKIQTLEARVQSLESQLGAAAAPSNNPPPQESSENDNSGSEDTESAETPSDEAAAEMEPPAENPGSESAEETERSEAESPPKSTVEPEPIIENPEPADAPASE